MSAMTLLAVVLEFSRCRAPDIQGAPLKLVWLALGYAAAMAFANLVFSLGPFIEAKLRPENVNRFRRWSFGLGFAISMALPLTLPIVYLSRC